MLLLRGWKLDEIEDKSSSTEKPNSYSEQAKVGYLSALVKQNWIIIRKFDELNKKLNN